MKVFLVAACAWVTWASAGAVRSKRFLTEPRSALVVSSGYGGAYAGYGDYSSYGNSFPSDYAPAFPPGYSSYGSYSVAPSASGNEVVNVEKVDIPKTKKERKVVKLRKVVKVRKLSKVPKLVKVKKVVAAPRYSAGYIGYGSGVRSRYTSIPDYFSSNGVSYPGYASNYASGSWIVHM